MESSKKELPEGYEQKLAELLEGKNPAQQQGISTVEGPVMIIAGAGSGKTTVLINRTANMLEMGISPSSIMLITFTNKSATEIKDRLRVSVGERADYITVGTFHSVFKEHILLKYKDHSYFAEQGLDMDSFVIFDDKDSERIYKDAYETLPLSIRDLVDGGTFNVASMTSEISAAKAKGLDLNDYMRTIAPKDKGFQMKQGATLLWKSYQEMSADLNGMDFDDMLLHTKKLLQSDKKIAIELASKFKYLMIDEYQDTNPVQMSATDALAMIHKNICTVGDEKQSIYGFRGSDINVILGMERRYPNVKKINMAQNYRSCENVITVGNAVADAMGQRLTDGQLVASAKLENSPVKMITFEDDKTEAYNIVKSIMRDLRNGVPGKEIAVIYRNRALNAEIEKNLVKAQVPYTLVGDTSFYQRAEIRDAVAMLRFIFRPWDSMAGLRVLNSTNFGVSSKAARDAMKSDKMPVYRFLCKKAESKLSSGAPNAVAKKCTAFLRVIDSVKRAQEIGANPSSIKELLGMTWDTFLKPKMQGVAKKSAKKDAAANLDGKIENVSQIFEQFAESYQESGDIDKVLDDIILRVEANPEMDKERSAKVQLLTIHASKGLEFENVYLVGMDKQTLPGKDFSELDRDEIEESRRLVYTGITRCKKNLVMSYAEQRLQFGQPIVTEVSPFIQEIRDRTSIMQEIHVKSNFKRDYQSPAYSR